MELIPVIDLLQGQVVRAQRGVRSLYRPIQSTLCRSSDPLAITYALLELYPFKTLYIADLDAIQERGSNTSTILELKQHFPNTHFWLDAGLPTEKLEGIQQIIGTERLETLKQYQSLISRLLPEESILSLDFNSDGLIGPTQLETTTAYWPRQIICMSLSKVGSYDGPDLGRLSALSAIANSKQVYAAGGVRNIHDLGRLQSHGAAGALIASSLHDGIITATEIMEFMA